MFVSSAKLEQFSPERLEKKDRNQAPVNNGPSASLGFSACRMRRKWLWASQQASSIPNPARSNSESKSGRFSQSGGENLVVDGCFGFTSGIHELWGFHGPFEDPRFWRWFGYLQDRGLSFRGGDERGGE
jgi:hypothetical protein